MAIRVTEHANKKTTQNLRIDFPTTTIVAFALHAIFKTFFNNLIDIRPIAVLFERQIK